MKYYTKQAYRFFKYFKGLEIQEYLGYRLPYSMSDIKRIMFSDDQIVRAILEQKNVNTP